MPVTILRDGPLGEGAVQRFVDHDPDEHYFTLLDEHEDRFRQFAVFDVLANNTDRKGGHCLHDLVNDVIVGIDHGLTFHAAWKLRTVIWDFAGEPVPDALPTTCAASLAELDDGPLGERARRRCSTAVELDAVAHRAPRACSTEGSRPRRLAPHALAPRLDAAGRSRVTARASTCARRCRCRRW